MVEKRMDLNKVYSIRDAILRDYQDWLRGGFEPTHLILTDQIWRELRLEFSGGERLRPGQPSLFLGMQVAILDGQYNEVEWQIVTAKRRGMR